MGIMTCNISYNDRDTMFGMPQETWWKLFLEVHDRAHDRRDFAEKLERELLDYHIRKSPTPWCVTMPKVVAPTCIHVYNSHWKDDPKTPFQHGGKLLARGWNDQCSYPRMVRRCAQFFGVDEDMIPNLPKRRQNKAELQAYFLSLTTSAAAIRRVS